jgi:hypothetical protein
MKQCSRAKTVILQPYYPLHKIESCIDTGGKCFLHCWSEDYDFQIVTDQARLCFTGIKYLICLLIVWIEKILKMSKHLLQKFDQFLLVQPVINDNNAKNI